MKNIKILIITDSHSNIMYLSDFHIFLITVYINKIKNNKYILNLVILSIYDSINTLLIFI
jgi:2',3'-cyclic-nucleotide 2'-phosphodiesterase (5'-nucleotidase family)